MSLISRLKSELIDIIELPASDKGLLAHRFPRQGNEIKMGAKLTVREGQAAVFVNEGKIADVYQPGLYTLTTQNMPVLTSLKGWKYGFESPYKAEIYFINTTLQTDHKWGTSNPIMMRDKDFGIVRLRGFGTYVFRVIDPAAFLRQLVAASPDFESYEVDGQLRHVIVARVSDAIGKSGLAALDLVGNYEALATVVINQIKPEFVSWGLDIVKFYVENISLPAEVEQAIDRRSAMGAVGDLGKYTQFQTAEAIPAMAAAPGGGGNAMSAGFGLGAGLAVAQHVGGILNQPGALGQPQAGAPTPPPLPNSSAQFHAALDGQAQGPLDPAVLKQYIDQGRVTRETLVWKAGMAAWVKAGEAPELSGLFAAVPPPLPK